MKVTQYLSITSTCKTTILLLQRAIDLITKKKHNRILQLMNSNYFFSKYSYSINLEGILVNN
jgi:hypothetical protein